MAKADYIVGGLLAGTGKGLVEVAKQAGLEKRERVLAELRHKQNLEVEGVRDTNATRRQDRLFEHNVERDEARSGQRMEEAGHASELRTAERKGLLSNTENFVDAKGRRWVRTPDEVKPLTGPDGEQLTGVPKGLKTSDLGGLSAGDKRVIDVAVKRYTNADTGKIDYEGVAAHLRATGHPGLAKFISGGAGAITHSQAIERATKEADERTGFFSSRSSEFPETKGNKQEWITRRAREIMSGKDGGAATPETRGGAPKKSSGATVPVDDNAGRQRQKPVEYPDAQWSDRAKGWVVQRDGKWYRVRE
jgi:hypothetical protein